MPSTTPNYGLALYNSTTDQSENFQNFRLALAGTQAGSNMNLIDTALKGLADDVSDLQSNEAMKYTYATLSGNAAVATVSGITAYNSGLMILLVLDTNIAGTTTLNINSLGAKSLMRIDETNTPVNLVANELQIGTPYIFRYDGTRFVWVTANQGHIVQVNGVTFPKYPILDFIGESITKEDSYPATNIRIDGSIWSKNVETLSAPKIILDTDPPIQALNPGDGITRNVYLPSPTINRVVFIINTNSNNGILSVKQGVTGVGSAYAGEIVGFIADGTIWRTITATGYTNLVNQLGSFLGYGGQYSDLSIRLSSNMTDGISATNASGNISLTNYDSFLQVINPNGANRDVILPDISSIVSHGFIIINTSASSSYSLVIKNYTGTTITTLYKDETAFITYGAGTTGWKVITPPNYQSRSLGFQDAMSATTTTASGTITLTDASNAIQYINPNGAARDVILPANAATNHGFWIYNSGTSDYNLVVKNASSVVIANIPFQKMLHFVSDGTTWVSLGGMYKQLIIQNAKPTITSGCAASAQIEMGTNKNVYDYLAFDPSTVEYAYANIPMPDDYLGGTIYASFNWLHPTTTTNFGVSWGLSGVAISDGGNLDVAQGTPQYANDTGGSTSYLYISPMTSAITIAGTPTARKMVNFRISRNATDGTNDTLAVDAYLLSANIWYKVG